MKFQLVPLKTLQIKRNKVLPLFNYSPMKIELTLNVKEEGGVDGSPLTVGTDGIIPCHPLCSRPKT